MAKILYRVGEGANLEALPRGTKVGDEIRLTEAEALYERDMGRLIDVEAEKAGAVETEALAAAAAALSASAENLNAAAEASQVVPGETQVHPVDAVTGEPLALTDEERARLPVLAPAADGPQTAEADGIVKLPAEGDTLTLAVVEDDAVASKSRRR